MATLAMRPGAPASAAIVGHLELLATDNHGTRYQVRDVRTFATVGRIVRDCVDNTWVAFDVRDRRVAEASTAHEVAVRFDRHLATRQ